MCAAARSYSEELVMGQKSEVRMNLDSIVSLALSALLLIYLAYALLRPEKF